MISQAEYLREEEVIMALRNSLGNLNIAAKELGLSRGQINDYITNHPDVRTERAQILEGIKDDAEDMLFQKMKANDTLLMFFLRTKAADRGYGNGLTVSGDSEKPIEMRLNARSLIKMMRDGAKGILEEKDEIVDGSEEEHEDSDILEQ